VRLSNGWRRTGDEYPRESVKKTQKNVHKNAETLRDWTYGKAHKLEDKAMRLEFELKENNE
jgi:hypothetical protein